MADEFGRVIVPPTEEQIDIYFRSMDDSANRINSCVADDTEFLIENNNSAAETKNDMQRNVNHMENLMSTDWYKDSNKDKSLYVSAVAAGKNYISS
jgi:hypothetical protein